MRVKRTGITEILRRIWLFITNKMKSSESGNKQPTQLIVEFNSTLTKIFKKIEHTHNEIAAVKFEIGSDRIKTYLCLHLKVYAWLPT